jgi:dihydrofolate synthase / folylpolyglutamate synthase
VGDRLTAVEAYLAPLYARTTGEWRLGLDRMEALLHALGDPHKQLRVIHVGGTNGKGSVCATLDAVLRAEGHRVARYTSPHLVRFAERIVIDGQPIPDHAVVDFLQRWMPSIEAVGATFFEATTAMAFRVFADAAVDIAVIEVGLGGRLDATNVVDPLLAVVTTVDLDHTEYLGPTRSHIAAEKAGIFKPDRPAIIGVRDPVISAELVAHARQRGAAPIGTATDWARVREVEVTAEGTRFQLDDVAYRTGLLGAYQAENAALALQVLEALPAPFAVSRARAGVALEAVRLPGRLQRVGRYLFDVAHNPAGASVLADALSVLELARPVTAVVAVLSDKDWRGMLHALAPAVDGMVLTIAPTAPAERRWVLSEVAAYASASGIAVRVESDFTRALRVAEAEGGTVLITGSFHTVGDAMCDLDISPYSG